jgi:hypothetical protein
MGVQSVTRAAAAGDGPAPEKEGYPIYYYAAAGGGVLVLIGAAGFLIRKSRSKKSGPRYHDEYVQMTEQLSNNNDSAPAPLHRV